MESAWGRGDRPVTPFSPTGRSRIRGAVSIAACVIFLLFPFSVAGAGSATVSVSATILSNGRCWFTTNGTTLDFGTLDPGNPVDVTVGTVLRFRCLGFPAVTYSIGDDDGLHETGTDANRMLHASLPGAYLPYSMDLSPRSATISWSPFVLRTVNITGTVRGVDYQAAAAGSYSDTVVVSIDP